ncbi:sensor histidine kinase [Paenibacillus sp. GCM10023252]|uniref:sensor histidine kinase n=1 Tax=Paenibacillus sp. GCM10023252 TaxID=3252649 RepID=UPI00361B5150
MRYKLLLTYLIIVLIPLVITVILFLQRTNTTVREHTDKVNQITLEQIADNVFYNWVDLLDLTDSLQQDQELIKYLEENHSPADDTVDPLITIEQFKAIRDKYDTKWNAGYKGVKLKLYSSNPSIIRDDTFIVRMTPELMHEEWMSDILRLKGTYLLSEPYQGSDREVYFRLGRTVRSGTSTIYSNAMILEISESYFYGLISREGQNKDIYILNDRDQVYSSTSRESVGKLFLRESIREERLVERVLPDRGVLQGWKVAVVLPEGDITQKMNGHIRFILWVMGGHMLLAVAFMLVFSQTLTKRLRQLVRTMAEIRDGKLKVEIQDDSRDEIGELSRGFRRMMERIHSLIDEVYNAEVQVKTVDLQKKEAELRALQSQINPHFLFNTLESIRMNSYRYGDKETSEIIGSLAKLLRGSVYWDQDLVPLRKELDTIREYMNIQRFRFEQISMDLIVPEELLSISLPKFTLQPLVENAIQHGMESKLGATCLEIAVWREIDSLFITVSDDGAGMEPAKLEEVIASMRSVEEPSRSIGLRNVYQRLLTYYGEHTRMSIESAKQKGTRIVIEIKLTDVKSEQS